MIDNAISRMISMRSQERSQTRSNAITSAGNATRATRSKAKIKWLNRLNGLNGSNRLNRSNRRNDWWNALGFRPGLVGGHCIGVDPYYLTNISEKLGYHSQIILPGRKVSDSMGSYVADAAIKEMIEAGLAPKKAKVVVLGVTFKENCPDVRNSKVIDIIKRLREYEIKAVVCDPVADKEATFREYGIHLTPFEEIEQSRDADCIIVAVGHKEYRSLSVMQLKELFRDSKDGKDDAEKVLIDVKALYRIDELKASGMRFWRL